jgi:isoamylase
VNFALLCRHGTHVSLILYHTDRPEPMAEIPLDPKKNRTGDHWHIHVSRLPATFRYGWRVDGPEGDFHRFNPRLVLLDPAATAISDGDIWGREPDTRERVGLNYPGTSRRSLYVRQPFDWREDEPPLIRMEDSIIYELHVRAFTCHPSSMVAQPGTFQGIIEKIPYLRDLGVTAVELLPVHEFDENDCPFSNPRTGQPNRNLWGYNSISFAAVKAAYAASASEFGQANEFREMVRAFHEAGIEVILDVVFNHTGEGNERGRSYSFRGLDNELYYMLGPDGEYLNFSGCGNTVNCNHPVVRDLIMTCLRFWVSDMHVDGLRFDLASVLGRDQNGHVLAEPPIVESIVEDGVLAHTKLIAEPWDAAGLYQVGLFPFGKRWSEWNGKFRDDIRRFWRGDMGTVGTLATRLCGSADLYESAGRQPQHSINFVTCHDGFTLWDLVSYNRKHNEANGEGNRDGCNDNYSWNCGAEGPTDDPHVLKLRQRQARNLMATLMLSQGVPMLLAGDEFLRTQNGNNNAWCQDNEISWVDWSLADKNAGFLRFTKMLIALRRAHPALRRNNFFRGNGSNKKHKPDIIWHGVEPYHPNFSYTSRTLAFCLDGMQTGRETDNDFYIALNSWRQPTPFRIPPAPNGKPWRRIIDTSLASPKDFMEPKTAPPIAPFRRYMVPGHSLVVLISEG